MPERISFRLLPFVTIILVALYPVIALASANADEVSLQHISRSLVASVVLAILLLLLVRSVAGDWEKAALISSVALLLFFSYGHLYQLVKSKEVIGFVVGRHRYLLLVWIVLLATWAWVVLKVLRNVPAWIGIFTIAAAAAIANPLFSLVGREAEIRAANARGENLAYAYESVPRSVGRDIYYIVLDGYGRQDVLSRIYDLDNTDFIGFLKSRDFYVAEKSRSNYVQTALSLASSMNLNYVNDLSDTLGEDSTNRGPLNARIHNNFAMEFLERNGYQLMAFNTGLVATSIEDVDVYLPSEDNPYFRPSLPATWLLNPIEGLLLETTAVSGLLDLATQLRGSFVGAIADPLYEVHRARITYTLDAISEVPGMSGDFFVFAHVVAPHPPFVFGSIGEPVNPDRPYGLFDGSDFLSEGGTTEEYIAGYRDELVYLNTLLEDTIDEILARSDPSPIIVLQSDHGPGAFLNWASASLSDLEERTSILNAYHLPDGGVDALYPSISPVNSFRVIFNHYFDGDFPLLEDRAYFSSANRPYSFVPLE
ncbi:MAG: hypothetical protein IIA89_10940 [Chloroflexi bacterium]|nr:hypothetical protein [Chloroflexota bacterium]